MNRDAFENGLKTRRAVLGTEYVDASIASADDFNMPMQELVTEYCWNEIWNKRFHLGSQFNFLRFKTLNVFK